MQRGEKAIQCKIMFRRASSGTAVVVFAGCRGARRDTVIANRFPEWPIFRRLKRGKQIDKRWDSHPSSLFGLGKYIL